MSDYRRRHDDPETVWEFIVMHAKRWLFWLGLVGFGIALAFGYMHFSTQAKEPSVTTPDCGSCKRGENK